MSLILLSVSLCLFSIQAHAEAKRSGKSAVSSKATAEIERELDEIQAEVMHSKKRIEQLESLLTSLVDSQSYFAGYGVRRSADDIKRVRAQLYKHRTGYGELIAKKLYLQHELNTRRLWDKMAETDQRTPKVEPQPTTKPEDCPNGVVNIRGQWHCLRAEKKSIATRKLASAPKGFNLDARPKRKGEECKLGTIEVKGVPHCIGYEPGGALSTEPSTKFLIGLYDGKSLDDEEAEGEMEPTVSSYLRY